MFKINRTISIITIFVMLISAFSFTVSAENETKFPITVTNEKPQTYTLDETLTSGKHKISTQFVYSEGASDKGDTIIPNEGILVQDSNDKAICGLKISSLTSHRFSVAIGSEDWVIHTNTPGTGTYTLDMILDIDNKTVEYALSGEGVTFKAEKVFYGYFKIDSDGKLVSKQPIPLENFDNISKVYFYRETETGEFAVNSVTTANVTPENRVTESSVTYSEGVWTGTNSMEDIGLYDNYSFGNNLFSDDDSAKDTAPKTAYTVKHTGDEIYITGGSNATELMGVTKTFGEIPLYETAVIKTSFYNDGTKQGTGFGTAVRLVGTGDNKTSWAFAVGKQGDSSADGTGIAMRWSGPVGSNKFDKSLAILNRTNGSATLESNTWYDLTLTVERTDTTKATITATLEWPMPSGYENFEAYQASFATGGSDLTYTNGIVSITKSAEAGKANINAIELLQSTAGSGYVGSTSKFKEVSLIIIDGAFNIKGTGDFGQSSTYTSKVVSGQPTEVMVFRACYNAQGMKWAEIERNVIVGETVVGTHLNVQGNSVEKGDTVKLFMFDKNLRPLLPAQEKAKQQ